MSNTHSLVKNPYTKTVFKTDKELKDFIKCCDPKTGHLYFMDNFFMIQHPTKGSMVYHPWDYQKRLIHTYHDYRFSISLMPRQSGKCFGINTVMHIKNTLTGVEENITIGKFYDRHCSMLNLQCQNEGTTFPSVPKTSTHDHAISSAVSGSRNQNKGSDQSIVRESVRDKESGIQSQGEIVTVLEKVSEGGYLSSHCEESKRDKDRKSEPYYTNRLLVEEDRQQFRRSITDVVGAPDYFFVEDMCSKTRGRKRTANLGKETEKVGKEFQEAEFLKNFSNTFPLHNGKLPVPMGLFCHASSTGYGQLYQQGISSYIEQRKNYSSGFHRLKKEEDYRVRRDILARTSNGKPTEGSRERASDYTKRIHADASARAGFQKQSRFSSHGLCELSDSVDRKFIETYELTNYEISTDSGWQPLSHLHKTIKYDVWVIETETGSSLEGADTHILFDENFNQVFIQDLSPGDIIKTKNGNERVQSIIKTARREHMFDISVASTDHRFYSNSILSHNSTSAAGYLLWYAMFVPDSTILIAAHKYTGAQEIMQRIRYAYENCPNHIKAGVTTYNKGSLDFENGSRIVSATTTENTGRGMSITLLYLDEFAFVRPSIAQEFWTSITPTLSTGGKAIITSTPNSDEDQFALIWKQANKTEDAYGNKTELGVNGFKAYQSHWSEQPGRDQKWADEIKAQLGEDKFRREIGLEFLIADETLINPNTLLMLQGTEPTLRQGQIRWYKQPSKGNIYIVALDPSIGTGGDPAAIQIFEANSTTQIGEWKHNKTDIPGQIKLIAQITKYIAECTNEPNNIYYSVENNSIGEAALVSLNEYGESNIQGIFISEPGKKRKGFNTGNKTKLAACAKFKTLLESKKLNIHSFGLISELKGFVASGGSYAAKIGDTDDLVMATLLAVRIIQQLGDYHYDLESHIRDHAEMIAPLPFFAVIS